MNIDSLWIELSALRAIGHGDKPVRLEVMTHQDGEDSDRCAYDYEDLESIEPRETEVLLKFW